MYYHRSGRVALLPRVAVGTPYSWDPTISTSGKDDYLACTWSPCGRFVAALIGNTVEIRNQLTFELLTTLQPTDTAPPLTGPLAYSPDGHSLACGSHTAIMIWDIQTGGVAREIMSRAHTITLLWLSDGGSIGTLERLYPDSAYTETHFCTYDVSSDTLLFAETIDSSHKPYLWAYEESFRVMTIERYTNHGVKIQIQFRVKDMEVRSLLTTIHTFSITAWTRDEDISTDCTPGSEIISFSPTTSHISVSTDCALRIFQDCADPLLLEEKGRFLSPCFSSDGRLFAASKGNDVYVWKYPDDYGIKRYGRWREFRCQDWINSSQFSPTPSSFLSHSGNILQVWRLNDTPDHPGHHFAQYAALSPSCAATALRLARTVTIIYPNLQCFSLLIDTGVLIEGLLLTSNLLLVVGSGKVVAWLVKEEVLASGVLDNRTLDYDDRIWAILLNNAAPITSPPQPKPKLTFHVEGQIGVIEHESAGLFVYHTTTGELLQPSRTPPRLSGPGLDITGGLCGRHHPYCNNLPQRDIPLEASWWPSETALKEGWVKDSEGRHRLWLDVEWRKTWDLVDWCHDITTQFSIVGPQPVIVKF